MRTSSIRPIIAAFAIVGLLFTTTVAMSADYKEAPADVSCAILLKVLTFNKSLEGEVTVHVLGAPKFAAELTKHVGKSVGKSIIIKAVEAIDILQEVPPDILYIGDAAMLAESIAYTREKKILSAAKSPSMISRGVSIGVGLGGQRPKILLNPGASKQEGIKWSPAIFKLSVIIKTKK